MQRKDSLEKTLMLGKIEGSIRWLDGITNWMDMSLRKLWELVLEQDSWACPSFTVASGDLDETLSPGCRVQHGAKNPLSCLSLLLLLLSRFSCV